MRPYRDAFKFFLWYPAAMGLIYMFLVPIIAMLPHIPSTTLGAIIIFAPFIVLYFLLVRLLKRYIAFYDDIVTIRAEVKMPYGEDKPPSKGGENERT